MRRNSRRGTSLDFFAKIKYGNVEAYLPHRDREGYGFHIEAIEELATRDVKLIITVDVGTNAVDAVRFAREKGVDVIVTDHHELSADPVRSDASNGAGAVAVLNPKLTPDRSVGAGSIPISAFVRRGSRIQACAGIAY